MTAHNSVTEQFWWSFVLSSSSNDLFSRGSALSPYHKCDSTTIRWYHGALDYDESDQNYDLRFIPLRYEYDEKLTCSFFASQQVRAICRSRIAIVITPLLRSTVWTVKALVWQLHWLPDPEHVQFKLCVLAYRSLNGLGPDYLSNDFMLVSNLWPGRPAALAVLGTTIPRVATVLFCHSHNSGMHCGATSPLRHLSHYFVLLLLWQLFSTRFSRPYFCFVSLFLILTITF